MKSNAILHVALRLILVGGLGAGTLLPGTAPAKEPKGGKKAAQGALPPEGQELSVKAAELTKVTYKGPAGVQTLKQISPMQWRSANLAYREVERDEFSVYLHRMKTDERVVIDLHTRKVSFFAGSIDGEPLASYALLSASSGKE